MCMYVCMYVCMSVTLKKIAKLFLSVRSTQFPFKLNILSKKEYSNLLGPKILGIIVCYTLSLEFSLIEYGQINDREDSIKGVTIKIMIHSLYCRPSSGSHSDSWRIHHQHIFQCSRVGNYLYRTISNTLHAY